MSNVMIPRKTQQGWVIDLTPDFAEALGVAQGSIAILYAQDGKIDYEILPPPTPELIATSERLYNKYKEVSEELKRLGD